MVLPPPLSVLAHSLLSLNTFPVYWPIITPSIDHLEGLLPDCLSAVLNALSSSTDRTGLRTRRSSFQSRLESAYKSSSNPMKKHCILLLSILCGDKCLSKRGKSIKKETYVCQIDKPDPVSSHLGYCHQVWLLEILHFMAEITLLATRNA